MASAAQLAANRANAQKSTGPRTPEGKAASSRNALKLGFYSKAFIVSRNETEDFEEFQKDLLAEIDPRGALTMDLFAQLLHAAWNLHRLRRIENRIYASSSDPFTDYDDARCLDRLAAHRTRFERSYHRALTEIRSYITNLYGRSFLPRDVAEEMPDVVSVPSIYSNRMKMFKAWDRTAFMTDAAKATLDAATEQRRARSSNGSDGFYPHPDDPSLPATL